MACPQIVAGEDSLQIWKVYVNILHKQLGEADKVWYSTLEVM
jgi:hypothetical protein